MDFRPMRRKTQELTREEAVEMLLEGTSGVLAVAGDAGYPYAVPLSYVYDPCENGIAAHDSRADADIQSETAEDGGAVDAGIEKKEARRLPYGRIIFHSALKGHKVDAVRSDPRASFCVIDQDAIVPDEFTTYFRSVIAFGRVRPIEDEDEKRSAIRLLSRRYSPSASEEAESAEIEGSWKSLCVLELAIEHLSAKEAIELVKKRNRG